MTIDGCISEVNQVMCEILGFSSDELVGATPPWPFWPPEGIELGFQLIGEVLANARETGRPQTFEILLMRKDGNALHRGDHRHSCSQPGRVGDGLGLNDPRRLPPP